MTRAGSIFSGRVVHVRHRPRVHRLHYRVFALLLDLDRLAETAATLRLFGHNTPALVGMRDRDHGAVGHGGSLRAWVDGALLAAGLAPAVRVEMLCYPRLLGFVFNPLTVYYCRDAADRIQAVIHEVHNTFGERHAYVLPADGDGPTIRQRADKVFHVSPFVPMQATYRFSLRPPGDDIVVAIREDDADGRLLDAVFTGRRRPLTDRTLLAAVLRHPLMTYKIIAGIHYEAARLWLKGVPYLGRTAKESS